MVHAGHMLWPIETQMVETPTGPPNRTLARNTPVPTKRWGILSDGLSEGAGAEKALLSKKTERLALHPISRLLLAPPLYHTTPLSGPSFVNLLDEYGVSGYPLGRYRRIGRNTVFKGKQKRRPHAPLNRPFCYGWCRYDEYPFYKHAG